MGSIYRSLTGVISILLAWMGVGWVVSPTLILKLSEYIGESVKFSEVAVFAYPLAVICFILSAVSVWWWWNSSPPTFSDFRRRVKGKFLKCPYCGEEIVKDAEICPYCNSRLSGTFSSEDE